MVSLLRLNCECRDDVFCNVDGTTAASGTISVAAGSTLTSGKHYSFSERTTISLPLQSGTTILGNLLMLVSNYLILTVSHSGDDIIASSHVGSIVAYIAPAVSFLPDVI